MRLPIFKSTNNVWSSITNCYFCLQVNQRLYINAGVIFLIYLVSTITLPTNNAKGFLFLFFLFWVTAICFDLVALYNKFSNSALLKVGLFIVAGLCTNFSLVLSSQLVNDVIGIDPSTFPHTVALISTLCIPIFVALGLGVSLVAVLALSPLFIMLAAFPDDKAHEVLIPGYSVNKNIPYLRITRTVQLVSFAVFCGYVISFAEKTSNGYVTFLTETARDFIYQWEMYPKAPCKIPNDARVAFLGDKLLIAEKNASGITFTVQSCQDK